MTGTPNSHESSAKDEGGSGINWDEILPPTRDLRGDRRAAIRDLLEQQARVNSDITRELVPPQDVVDNAKAAFGTRKPTAQQYNSQNHEATEQKGIDVGLD